MSGPRRTASSTAWRRLARPLRANQGPHLRRSSPRTPGRAERFTVEARGLIARLSPSTASSMRRCACWCSSPKSAASPARRDAMFRGEKINATERRAVLHVALRAPRGSRIEVDRQGRGARGPRGAGPHGRVRRPSARRIVARPHRQAHPHRRQHRHRRLLSRAGDGVSGAASIQRPDADAPLRLQRRRRQLRRGDAGDRSRRKPCSSSRRRRSPPWRR